ncbi:MAG: trypsin-like serine protease [Pseudohongiella sp.]|nr:trypsin-like serine protease [Pseudohongiella sp.]MDO9520397.1 trypsin-like serine protease [Pseudohongiella sp.]
MLKPADLLLLIRQRYCVRQLLQTVVLCLCAGAMLPASAIVTRHDTGYSRFLASESDYPAVFPLHVEQQRKTCVATLISQRWALTAAHCAGQTPLNEQLQATGSYPVTIAGQQFSVDRLVFHPAWTEAATDVFDPDQIDLVLLRLDADVAHVRFIPLYAGDQELGQILTFLGWGYSGIGRTGISVNDGRLRFAHNRVSAADRQLYFRFNDPQGPGSLAVDFEGIPGLGDSGGPALMTGGGLLQLAGIAVGELEAGANNHLKQPGGRYGATVVYERVSRHIDWIWQVIAADHKDDL